MKRIFVILQAAIENWGVKSGHRDAYVRGSQSRRDLAEQINRYRKMHGRREFVDLLEKRLREHVSKE